MADELKPCERCGGNPEIAAKAVLWGVGHPDGNSGVGYRAECDGCGTTGCWWHTRDQCVVDWNRRTMPECVRAYLDKASQWIGYQGKIETKPERDAVLKHYGVEK